MIKIKLISVITLILLFTKVDLYSQLMQAKNIYSKADSLRGQLTPLRTCYDIKYYHLDVTVDIAKKHIAGSNLFKFQAVENFQKLQFDLFFISF